MRREMICRFADESCPADCAHLGPHAEIVDDDFGEHSPCVIADVCESFGLPTYCVPVPQPNRVVVEIVNGFVKKVLAERPDEALVIVHDPVAADICESYGGDYEPRIFGDGGEPIEPLPVERAAVGVVGGAVEVAVEVSND